MEDEQLKKFGIAAAAVIVLGAAVFAVTGLQNTQETPDNTQEPANTQNNAQNSENKEVLLPETSNKTTIYFFYGETCPYCAKEKPFLEELDEKHEGLEVKMYEVYNSRENQRMYQNVAEKYEVDARGVPATFIGDRYFRGYNERVGQNIESKVEECLENTCKSPLE